MRYRTFEWLSLAGSLASLVGVLALWESPYRRWLIVGTIVAFAAAIIFEVQRERLSVFFSGVVRYYESFPVSANAAVFEGVQREYLYLGVTFGSVLKQFEHWYRASRPANVQIRLLLNDPEDAGTLEFQARYERNLLGRNLTATEQDVIRDVIRRNRDSIRLVLDTLATLPKADPPIEVYFHNERLRKWMHIVDGKLMYVGMLAMGADGLGAPVMQLRSQTNRWGVYEYYREQWESIWRTAKRVSIPSHSAPGA